MLFLKGMGEAINTKPKDAEMSGTERLAVLSIASAVNNQIEMTQ